MRSVLFWLIDNVLLGPLAPWVLGLALGSWPVMVYGVEDFPKACCTIYAEFKQRDRSKEEFQLAVVTLPKTLEQRARLDRVIAGYTPDERFFTISQIQDACANREHLIWFVGGMVAVVNLKRVKDEKSTFETFHASIRRGLVIRVHTLATDDSPVDKESEVSFIGKIVKIETLSTDSGGSKLQVTLTGVSL